MAPSATSKGICYLLELPAELRLKIYEYALQGPNGVMCELVWAPDKRFFRYFQLLYPIRDVLSPDFFRVGNSSSQAIVCSTTEVNKLRYICRQLNTETQGLILRVKEVILENGSADFIDFFRACPSAVLEHLRVVTIMSSELCWDRESGSTKARNIIDILREICTKYPKVSVRIRDKRLHPHESSTLMGALHFQLYYRKDSSLINQISKDVGEQATILADIVAYMSNHETKAFPTNLRLYPPFDTFDEKRFIEYEKTFYREILADDSDDDAEKSEERFKEFTKMLSEWHEQVAAIKTIFEHGA